MARVSHRVSFEPATICGIPSVWVSCSCGWSGDARTDDPDGDAREAHRQHVAHVADAASDVEPDLYELLVEGRL